MEFLTDESLILQVQNGQVDACGLLYKRYKKILFSYFYNNIRDKEKSEDLVHITFEKVLKYSKNFSGRSTFKQWIFSVAKNAFIDEYHKKNKHQSANIDKHFHTFSHDDHQERAMIENEKTALLYKAIGFLSTEKRALLSMVKLNEMKYKEAAQIYETSEANIKIRVFRIMKELKQHMASLKTEFN